MGAEGIPWPLVPRFRAHHVDVAVEDERSTVVELGGFPRGDDVSLRAHVPVEGRVAGVSPDRFRVHRNVDGSQADLEQGLPDDLLTRLLVVEHGGRLDEPGEHIRHPSSLRGDRVEDLLILGTELARHVGVRERDAVARIGERGRCLDIGTREAAPSVGAGAEPLVGKRLHLAASVPAPSSPIETVKDRLTGSGNPVIFLT
jgi:hypothetical protein